MAEEESNSKPSYPLKVFYCGNCSLPPEYCDFSSDTDRCREWLEKYLPDEFNRIMTCSGTAGGDDSDEKKRQKRGGKGMVKSKKKDDGPKQVCLSRAPRGKKKSVTVVTGLSTFNIDLKVAAKFFGTKFACGSSVTGEDEIVIQGDVKDDLFDIIPEKWPEIDEDYIEDLGDLKRLRSSRLKMHKQKTKEPHAGFLNFRLYREKYKLPYVPPTFKSFMNMYEYYRA